MLKNLIAVLVVLSVALMCTEAASLEGVAESLGISREEVRKLEQAHMRRMRDEEANTPSRGLRSQNNTPVIDDLLEQANGANDFIEGLLKKAKKDTSSLTPQEKRDLVEALNDEYANATQGLDGDKRLLDLVGRIENDDIVNRLLKQADGANDAITPLLQKFKKGELLPNEKQDLEEMLNDEFNNGTLAKK